MSAAFTRRTTVTPPSVDETGEPRRNGLQREMTIAADGSSVVAYLYEDARGRFTLIGRRTTTRKNYVRDEFWTPPVPRSAAQ